MPQVSDNENVRRFILTCLVNGVADWPFTDEPGLEEAFLTFTEEMEVRPILFSKLQNEPKNRGWPEAVVKEFRRTEIARFAAFELRKKEIRRVADALTERGIVGVWLKGLPFSYTLYTAPHHRPSSDTDILIARDALLDVEEIMLEMGYREAPDMLFGTISQQKQFCRRGRQGLEHAFEFHLRTNNRPLLALFGIRELKDRSMLVRADGLTMRAPSVADSFLMAVVHLLGHVPRDRRFLWSYDLKLLAEKMSSEDWSIVQQTAGSYGVQTLVGEAIGSLCEWSPRSIPEEIREWGRVAGKDKDEMAAYYLRTDRTRRQDLWMGIRTLPTWIERCRCLAQLVCPRPGYLRALAGNGNTEPLIRLYGRHWWKRLRGY